MPIVGPKIGLIVWSVNGDKWNTDQLASNWRRLEFHDHAPGRGEQIPTEGIKDYAITAIKLAPGANIITDGSVTPNKFAPVPGAKVYKDAVTSLPNNNETTLTFNQERFDTANVHDNSTNSNRLTASQSGMWMITASITTNVLPTTGELRLGIYKTEQLRRWQNLRKIL